MTKKRQILFSVTRGLLAILIAILVAMLLIFLSADGNSFAAKLSATGDALKQLLVGPLFRMGRSGTTFALDRLIRSFPFTIHEIPCERSVSKYVSDTCSLTIQSIG